MSEGNPDFLFEKYQKILKENVGISFPHTRVALYLPMWGKCVGSPQNSIFPVGIELSSIVGM